VLVKLGSSWECDGKEEESGAAGPDRTECSSKRDSKRKCFKSVTGASTNGIRRISYINYYL
jgi:hypothetical protein